MAQITPKAGVTGATRAMQAASEGSAKTGPSKFDMLRADLNEKLTGTGKVPKEVTTVTPEQKRILENDLRRRIETAKNPRELFSVDMKRLENGIADLNRKVASIPNDSAFAPIRERLKTIELQFGDTSRLLRGISSLDNPQRLLAMQMEFYKLAQNVELMSRTCSEITSGVKTILGTQV